jgi:YD repeat-containing protein
MYDERKEPTSRSSQRQTKMTQTYDTLFLKVRHI